MGQGGAPRPTSPHEDRALCARCAPRDAPAEALGLDADEAGVEAARLHEFGVGAPFGHPSLIEHHDLVGARHGAEAMRDDEHLLGSGSTVIHIAYAVGYNSTTSFSTAFARAYGMSPSQWRAANRRGIAHVTDA